MDYLIQSSIFGINGKLNLLRRGQMIEVPAMSQEELFAEMRWKEERIKEMFQQKGWAVSERKTREEKKEKEMK